MRVHGEAAEGSGMSVPDPVAVVDMGGGQRLLVTTASEDTQSTLKSISSTNTTPQPNRAMRMVLPGLSQEYTLAQAAVTSNELMVSQSNVHEVSANHQELLRKLQTSLDSSTGSAHQIISSLEGGSYNQAQILSAIDSTLSNEPGSTVLVSQDGQDYSVQVEYANPSLMQEVVVTQGTVLEMS